MTKIEKLFGNILFHKIFSATSIHLKFTTAQNTDYAYSTDVNGIRGLVVDFENLNLEGWGYIRHLLVVHLLNKKRRFQTE